MWKRIIVIDAFIKVKNDWRNSHVIFFLSKTQLWLVSWWLFNNNQKFNLNKKWFDLWKKQCAPCDRTLNFQKIWYLGKVIIFGAPRSQIVKFTNLQAVSWYTLSRNRQQHVSGLTTNVYFRTTYFPLKIFRRQSLAHKCNNNTCSLTAHQRTRVSATRQSSNLTSEISSSTITSCVTKSSTSSSLMCALMAWQVERQYEPCSSLRDFF